MLSASCAGDVAGSQLPLCSTTYVQLLVGEVGRKISPTYLSFFPLRRLILVDAHALLYRSHFGFSGQRLATVSGEDTSISYGFLSTVLRLLEIQEPPTHFAVVMDHHGKTFRRVQRYLTPHIALTAFHTLHLSCLVHIWYLVGP